MNKKYQSTLWSLALGAMALASCSGDDLAGGASAKRGSVSIFGLEVSNAQKVFNDAAGASRAVYDVSDYIVDFYRSGEDTPCQTYVYGDMPGTVELPVGTYVAKVRSHDVKKAEWDKPYFIGQSESFVINAGEITEVAPVTCTFASLKVTIKFGPKLQAAAGNDVKVTVVANDEGKLEYALNETRAGYFEAIANSTTLVATFSGTVNGFKEEGIVRTYTDIAPGQHRIITYEIGADLPKPGEPTGSVDGSGINIDITYTDEFLDGSVDPGKEEVLPGENEPGKLPDISGGEDPNPGGGEDPQPPTGDAITFSGTLENGKEYINTDPKLASMANVQIDCPAGCKDIVVRIDSSFLTKEELVNMAGLNDEFSLTDEKYYQGLGDLGLPYGDGVVNQTSIDFNITDFMSLLGAGGTSTNVFTLTVTDNNGNTKSVTFTIKVA